jgi:hypothetical protein
MTVPVGPWRLTFSAEQLADLRHDKEFAFLITMGRMINALRFGTTAMNALGKRQDPGGDRVRMGAFLYVCGLIHELLVFCADHEDEWSSLTAYRDIFRLLDESQLNRTTVELLRAIRNRTAFHFDPSIPGRVLMKIPLDSYAFLAGDGRNRDISNFEFPDIITFAFLFGHLDDPARMFERFSEFFDELSMLTVRFLENAEDAVVTRLLDRGVRFEDRPADEEMASVGDSAGGDEPSTPGS